MVNKTLADAGFDGIFTEVVHNEKLGLINSDQLRLFQLKSVVDNEFTFDGLKKFLLRNIGHYIYSRERMKKFKDEDEMTIVGLEAVKLLNRRRNGDDSWLGDELGDLMLYVFLEKILEAPKLFSKFDLPSDAELTTGSSGIHLLQPEVGIPTYQLVFGKSRIVGDPRDAIDDAFLTIEAIKKDRSREIRLVESTVFDKQFTPEMAEHLKNLILPSESSAASHDTAFGVFLGYSLGLSVNNYRSDEFRAKLVEKMQLDIKAHVSHILDKIKVAKLERHSFYFYFLPFNEADEEKRSIMDWLISLGGAQDDR